MSEDELRAMINEFGAENDGKVGARETRAGGRGPGRGDREGEEPEREGMLT